MQLLPEWSPQEAILLAWPDEKTDWQPWLNEVQNTYVELIAALNHHQQPIILLARQSQHKKIQSLLPEDARVLIISADYNDTWIRDYGFLTCQTDDGLQALDFTFNGWGNKFNASKDNQVNKQVLAPLLRKSVVSIELVLEGGALEVNSNGELLSTSMCLLNPERNQDMSLIEYEEAFAQYLGATRTVILKHGHLEGDDTDGHIDTLVRFTPDHNLVVQGAINKPEDAHFEGLQAMQQECTEQFPHAKIFSLPLPEIYAETGDRLPASYANFLISNGAIFAPVYQEPEDKTALEILSRAYPDFQIIPINCQPLIQQYGSLHCISMQVPFGTLKPDIVERCKKGVSIYE
ncbi:MAG: agmatine deiminase family protein [Aestuariibacter sp.]